MNVFNRLIIVTLLILPGTCSSAFAKDYIVEMVFFADMHFSLTNPVRISTQPVIPNLQGAIHLDNKAVSHGFIRYPQEALTLTNQATALSKSERYKILKHVAWLQPGLAKEKAIAVRIHAGQDYRGEFKERPFAQADFGDHKASINQTIHELDGTVKVVLARYLHVYTDLAYRQPFNLTVSTMNNPPRHERILVDFAIKTHRKMRSKQLHYLDHPALGILVEIRPAGS